MEVCSPKEECPAPTKNCISPRHCETIEHLVPITENTPATIILNITFDATSSDCSNRTECSCACSVNHILLENTSQKEDRVYRKDDPKESLPKSDQIKSSCLENPPRKCLRIHKRRSASCCSETEPKNPQCDSKPSKTRTETPDCRVESGFQNFKYSPEPSSLGEATGEPWGCSKAEAGLLCPEGNAKEPTCSSKCINLVCQLGKAPREPAHSFKHTLESASQGSAPRHSQSTSKYEVEAHLQNTKDKSHRLENESKENCRFFCSEEELEKPQRFFKSATNSCCSGISAKGSLSHSKPEMEPGESLCRSRRLCGSPWVENASKDLVHRFGTADELCFNDKSNECPQRCENMGTLSLRSRQNSSLRSLNCTKELGMGSASKAPACGSKSKQMCCIEDAAKKSCSCKHTTKPFPLKTIPKLSSPICTNASSQGFACGSRNQTETGCTEHASKWSTRIHKPTEGTFPDDGLRDCVCNSKLTESSCCRVDSKQLRQNCIRTTPRCVMRGYRQTTEYRFVNESQKRMCGAKHAAESSCPDESCKEFLCDPKPLMNCICSKNAFTETPHNAFLSPESSCRSYGTSALKMRPSCKESLPTERADGNCSIIPTNASICQSRNSPRDKGRQVSCEEAIPIKSVQRTSKDSLDPDMQVRIDCLKRQRSNKGSQSIRSQSVSKVYQTLDAVIECQYSKQGLTPMPSLYCPPTSYPSRYSLTYNDSGETPKQRSFKITSAAHEDIRKLHELLSNFFDKLLGALDSLNKCDFGFCNEMVCLICRIQKTLAELIENLRYGTYKNELDDINERLLIMLDELLLNPHYVLLRLVEFGFNIYELGGHLREELLPYSFAQIVHKVQSRLYRLQTGRIIRQIYFVPDSMDPVIGTYFKSRRLLKLEHFCHCSVVLLPPDDPRSIYCPMHYRTIEVNFDCKRGRYIGFQQLLNQCAPQKSILPRLVASVYKRLSGAEVEISLKDLCEMETTEARISYDTIRGDMASGSGLAVAPKIEI